MNARALARTSWSQAAQFDLVTEIGLEEVEHTADQVAGNEIGNFRAADHFRRHEPQHPVRDRLVGAGKERLSEKRQHLLRRALAPRGGIEHDLEDREMRAKHGLEERFLRGKYQ